MCLSAQADVIGGIVIGAIGIDAVRHVDARPGFIALASLPLLLAFHQLDEAFVWWGLQGEVPAQVGRAAMWIYLVIAFVVLPVYIPVAVMRMEPAGRARNLMGGFVALGAVVSTALLIALIRGPVDAELGDYHIAYSSGLDSGKVVVGAYVLATCGALVLSGIRPVAIFGVVNLLAVAVLARITLDGFASLWCAWAAMTSAAFAFYLRTSASRPAQSGSAATVL